MTAVRLVRTQRAEADAPPLDAEQREVVEHRGGPLLVLAGPGTGKTTTLVESVVDRVERDGIDPQHLLVLTHSRRAAAALRERIARRLRRTVREPLARTFHSYAFGLLRREAHRRGDPPPRLITAAEQDLLIRELLRGDIEEFTASQWPQQLRSALLTRGFARQLRDLLLRMTERGLTPRQLAGLGRQHDRDDWSAVARFAHQYAAVTALRHPPAYDPAGLVNAAVETLRHDPELFAHERDARAAVLVDEYQDSDPAQQELLQLLAGGGRDLVVVGDPDQSIYEFRGAAIEGIRDFPERFRTAAGEPASVVALRTSRRLYPAIRIATRRIATKLGGPPRHRIVSASGHAHPGDVSVHLLPTTSAEAAFIVAQLRRAHLFDGVPWQSMAVLVRSAEALPVLRRGLIAAGVPVAIRPEEAPLADQPPVRALLDVVALATGQRTLDAELAVDLIGGPLCGADALALRRIRRALRNAELAARGTRASVELLVDALEQPAVLARLGEHPTAALTRLAEVLRVARQAAAQPAATVEDVLWAAWDATGLASRWSQAAVRGGPAGVAADRDLDAVVALFEAAARFTDRLPGEDPAGFLDQVRGWELPADSLAARGQPGQAVQVMTAHAAKGLEWDVVVVAGVQEGCWPDLRNRVDVLGTDALLAAAAGRADSPAIRHSARLADERRLFYVATTRARRTLIVTAVAAEDSQPSRFLDELDPAAATGDRPIEQPPRSLDLPSLVAALRRVTCDPSEPDRRRQGAARQLARLTAAGVRSAEPRQWYGLLPVSDDAALTGDGAAVRVSPSRLAEFTRCELRWLLTECGATRTETTTARIGSLVHELAEDAARAGWSAADVLAEFDRRWPEMDVGTGWVARREYDRTRPVVHRLGHWLEKNPRTLLAAEQPFDLQIGRARLVGQVDRLERDQQGRIVVVDFKTGTSPVSGAELAGHPQLGAYQLAVERGAFDAVADGERRSGGASLVQLRTSSRTGAREQTQSPFDQAATRGWAADLLQRSADGMAGASFTAVRTRWCTVCPALASCPAHPNGAQVTP